MLVPLMSLVVSLCKCHVPQKGDPRNHQKKQLVTQELEMTRG